MNFWAELKTKTKPIIGLSPMDGLTDYPFRKMITMHGKPDVIYTEFVCVDEIFHSKKECISEFIYDETQRPIVAQVFGIDPDLFYIAAQIVCELGFDGIDINMGCPSKNVAGRGAGAGLIKNPELAGKIIAATKKGIADWVDRGVNGGASDGANSGIANGFSQRVLTKLEATKSALQKLGVKVAADVDTKSETSPERKSIPVSVKTRTGYYENELETWLPFLLKQDLACIALHGRTFKQLYHGKADWQAIARAKEIVDSSAAPQKPLLLGNGDIASLEQAKEYCEKFNLDGVLIGRAFLGIPWLLNPRMDSGIDDGTAPAVTAGLAQNDLFAIILEHSKIQEDFDSKNFVRTRKHLAWYCKGFEGASALRQQLVLSNNFAEVKEILQNFLTKQEFANNL